jgi:hypothetical protein
MRKKLPESDSRMRVLTVAVVGIFAVGCVSPDTARLVPRTRSAPFYTINVTFDADNCPTSVAPVSSEACPGPPPLPAQGICVRPGRAVQWVSVPAGVPFEVYFDPFVGRPYPSRPPDETTRPVVIRNDTMDGDYKYSVLGVVCRDPDKAILDPAIRVER